MSVRAWCIDITSCRLSATATNLSGFSFNYFDLVPPHYRSPNTLILILDVTSSGIVNMAQAPEVHVQSLTAQIVPLLTRRTGISSVFQTDALVRANDRPRAASSRQLKAAIDSLIYYERYLRATSSNPLHNLRILLSPLLSFTTISARNNRRHQHPPQSPRRTFGPP